MAFDQYGNMWVSQPSKGLISVLEIRNGTVVRQGTVFRNLNNPHGLAFDPENPFMLYFAEEDRVSRVTTYSDSPVEKIISLPSGGNHTTRTIGFGPDNRLYVSIGSTCNVCYEEDPRRAAIYSMNRDGTDFVQYAKGLRNAVFFTWNPSTRKMWATEMGRDFLGDNIPPDEINIIEQGKNYGWPVCYGKNIHDTVFDKKTYIRNPCAEPLETGSFIDIPAHSAPLGLAFAQNSNWPNDYKNDLFVAYHGSWNRSIPTGYKIVRLKFSSDGKYQGVEDFITGWLSDGTIHGRPAGLVFGPGGDLFISDDSTGVIYKVSYSK
jgi:glucose/arabinose dehydrogenase